MKRQLYMGGGIMNAVPREQYGLGSIFKGAKKAVKGATKAVKKIASSDIGKTALLAAAAFGIPGTSIGGLFGRAGFGGAATGLFGQQGIGPTLAAGKAKFFPNSVANLVDEVALTGGKKIATEGGIKSALLKGGALAGLSAFLTSQYGFTEEQAEEELNDPEKLQSYLRVYYTNLNPNAGSEEIEEFVRVNSATGGRIGYQNAGPVLPPDPTEPVNPFGPKPPADAPVLPDRRMASNVENQEILEALFEKYLDMGLSPKEAADKAREEFDKMSMMTLENRGLAALGGRIKFAEGTDENIPNNPMVRDMASFAKPEDFLSLSNYFMNPRETDDFQTMQKERFMYGAKSSDTMLDKIKALFNKFLKMGLSRDAAKKEIEALVLQKALEEDDIQGLTPFFNLPSSELDELGETLIEKNREVAKQKELDSIYDMGRGGAALGGRIKKALGDSASMNAMQAAGIEGLPIRENKAGIKELDLRDRGGFIPPVGIKEKADDIPAMLSNNEFVFTAKAVKNAGDGDVEVGAQKMYDQMKMLEEGGRLA